MIIRKNCKFFYKNLNHTLKDYDRKLYFKYLTILVQNFQSLNKEKKMRQGCLLALYSLIIVDKILKIAIQVCIKNLYTLNYTIK